MNDVATIASPQAAHRRMYEPPWTIDSVLSSPHEVQVNVLSIALSNPYRLESVSTTGCGRPGITFALPLILRRI